MRLCDPAVFLGEIEVVGVGVAQAGTIAGLAGQPMKKIPQSHERSINRSLTQFLAGHLVGLLREIAFEGDSLLNMKEPETAFEEFEKHVKPTQTNKDKRIIYLYATNIDYKTSCYLTSINSVSKYKIALGAITGGRPASP